MSLTGRSAEEGVLFGGEVEGVSWLKSSYACEDRMSRLRQLERGQTKGAWNCEGHATNLSEQ